MTQFNFNILLNVLRFVKLVIDAVLDTFGKGESNNDNL